MESLRLSFKTGGEGREECKGRGVTREQGMPVFVPGLVPGEVWGGLPPARKTVLRFC